MAQQRLQGQRALVTGASSGIGAEIARLLAAEGANLVLTARREQRMQELSESIRKEHDVDILIIAADLSLADAPQMLFDKTEGADLQVDVLINNAGFGAYEHFVDIPWERQAMMMQLNMLALTHLTHLFVTPMIERGRGYVMNIASVAAYTSCPNFAVYGATKAYVRNFTEALDFELKGTGVNAIVISPGGVRTEFDKNADQKLKSMGEKSLMSADQCARISVNKMLAGRRSVIPGFMNAFGMWIMRFLPRAWGTSITHTALTSAVDKAPKQLTSE